MMRFLPLNEAHTAELVKMAAETGFFKDHEVIALEEVFDDYHAENHKYDHKAYVLEGSGTNLGFVYFAPAPMTEGSWQLWWIVVKADQQGKGLGGRLLNFAEDFCREKGGRVMFIETSSQPKYEPTRQFYLKYKYNQEAVLREFYARGDDMVVYRKGLD